MMHRMRPLLVSGAAMAMALVIVASVAVAFGVAEKLPWTDPDQGLTDEQRQARNDEAHARARQFLLDFVRSGKDPHELPPLYLSDVAPAANSLEEAAKQADLIVRGRVTKTTFEPGDGSLALATSTISIRSVIAGTASGEITVLQRGGPVPQDVGGALAQLEGDPVVLPGDEVILLLMSQEKTFRTVPGGGVFLVTEGRIKTIKTTQDSTLNVSLNGLAEDLVVQRLKAAAGT